MTLREKAEAAHKLDSGSWYENAVSFLNSTAYPNVDAAYIADADPATIIALLDMAKAGKALARFLFGTARLVPQASPEWECFITTLNALSEDIYQ